MTKLTPTAARPMGVPKQPMPDNIESRMVWAHKHGRALARATKAAQIIGLQTLPKLYETEQEREAFVAGYRGEASRAKKEWQSKVTES